MVPVRGEDEFIGLSRHEGLFIGGLLFFDRVLFVKLWLAWGWNLIDFLRGWSSAAEPAGVELAAGEFVLNLFLDLALFFYDLSQIIGLAEIRTVILQ